MVKVLRIPTKGGRLSTLREESYANENIREQLNTERVHYLHSRHKWISRRFRIVRTSVFKFFAFGFVFL